jgi:hypothetical protein
VLIKTETVCPNCNVVNSILALAAIDTTVLTKYPLEGVPAYRAQPTIPSSPVARQKTGFHYAGKVKCVLYVSL